MSIFEGLLGGLGNVSSLRMLGYAGALMGIMVTYHFLDEAKDAAQLAITEKAVVTAKLDAQTVRTSLAETEGKLLSEKQQRQGDKNTIAFLRKEVVKWKTSYETDMATCKKLLQERQGEIDRRKLNDAKLKAYSDSNPDMRKKVPNDLLNILNGN